MLMPVISAEAHLSNNAANDTVANASRHLPDFRTGKLVGNEVAPWLGLDAQSRVHLGNTVAATIERKLAAHEHLYLEGQKQSHVYLVLEGVVGLYQLLADGRRQITSFALPGDMIGLDCPHMHSGSAEALCELRVRAIPLSAIDRLMMSEPGFGQTLLRIAAEELADTRERLVSLGRKSATEKVAGFVLRLARRNGEIGQDPSRIKLPMKRSDIADFLGLTIETVSRNITRLRTVQVIRLVSISEIEIVNMDRLEAIAEGNEDGRLH